MALYKFFNEKLNQVVEKDFSREEFLQKLFESNLENLFGLKFVAREFQVEGYFLDTLAFDLESKSFVILEYKRDKSFSVVDQGLHYLSLLLNNKAIFVLEYNNLTGKNLKITDFDWSQIRIMFVARSFTPYQKGAINFKDFPIELWEVIKYESDYLDLHQIQSNKKAESINKISQSNASSIISQVKTYSIDDLIKGDWSESRSLYEKLSEEIQEIDPRITEKINKQYVAFGIGRKNFCGINIYKSKIRLDLNRTKPTYVNDPENKVIYMNRSKEYYNQDISSIVITNIDDINYAIMIIMQVFKKTYI